MGRKKEQKDFKLDIGILEQYLEIVEVMILGLKKNGDIVYINRKGEEILGYNREEILGSNWFTQFTPRRYQKKLKKIHKEVTEQTGGKPVFHENPIVTKTGEECIIRWHNTLLRDDEGEIIGSLSSGEDVTEQRKIEERYRFLFKNMLSGVVYQDSEGKIVSANPAAEEILGITLGQMQGKTSMDPRWSAIDEDGLDFEGKTHPAMIALRTGEAVRDVIMGISNPKKEKTTWVNTNAIPLIRPGEKQPYEVFTTFKDITERKNVTDKLLEEKAFIDALIDSLPGTFYVFDEQGRFIHWNKTLEDVSGYSGEEIIELGPIGFYSEEDGLKLTEKIRKVFKGEKAEGEVEFITKSGEKIPFLLTGARAVIDDKTYVVGIGIDQSERKETQKVLSEYQRMLSTLMSNLPGIAYRCKNDQEWTMLFLSDGCKRITGYDPRDLVESRTLSFSDMIHPDDRDFIWDHVQQALDENRPFELEYRIRTKSGEEKWVWEQGVGLLLEDTGEIVLEGIINDITDNKKILEDLRNSEEKYRVLIENAGEAIIVAQDGLIQYVNPKACDLSGYAKEEYPSRPFVDFIHPEDREMVYNHHIKRLNEAEDLDEYEFRTIDKSGKTIWARINTVLIEWNNKPATLNFLSDITTSKMAEEALRESEERYRGTLDNMLEGCQIIDHEWRYIYVNETAAKHGHRRKEDLLGKTMMEVYPHIQDMNFFHIMDECMKKRSTRKLENEFTYSDGSSRLFELSIQPVPEGVFILSIDMTERKQAEKALRESEERLIEAQRIAKMGDFTWDIDTGEVTWSDGMYELMGYDKSEKVDFEAVNRNLHHPDDLENVSQWLNTCISSGRDELTPMEYRVVRRDGEILYIRTVGIIERGEGESRKVFATVQDISQRKHVELALRESEERYRLLADNTLDVIWIQNLELEFTYVNPAIFRMMGYSQEEWVGSKLYDHCDENNFKYMSSMIAEEMTKGEKGEGAIFEAEILKKNGDVINVEIHGKIIFDDDNQPKSIQGTTQDITERKRAEKAIQESEEKYRNLFETSRDVIYRSGVDGELLDINRMGEKLSGFSRDEMIGMNVVTAFDGDPKRRVVFQKEVEKRGYIDDFESVYRVKDGTRRFGLETAVAIYDDEGKIIGYQGIIRDITDRRIAAEKLRESEEKWRNLFESSMDVVYLTTLEGDILDMNIAGEQLFGYPREVLFNMKIIDLYYDPRDRKKFQDTMKIQEYVKDYEIIFRKNDGRPVECVVTSNLRKDEAGNILGYQGIIRDTTETKKMQQKLIQTEKLSSLGGILSGVAHELNNPLAAIIGFSELLTRMDLPEDVIEKLNLIMAQSKRSAKIIKSLLTFAREHKPERKMVDVNAVIEESYNLREYELRTNDIYSRLDIETNLPKTHADPYQLQQVFVNMINNAYDAMKDQGGGSLVIRSLQKEMKIVIQFVDDGPGIPKEHINKIFDPFFTTKEVGQGTGLGLSIVYGIIEEHDGDIFVDSRTGEGTTFTIELPIVETEETPAQEEVVRPKKPDKTYSILVVEDEDSLRRFLSEALRQEGYDAKTCGNGEEAIDMIENNEFDAVITDIKMPGLSGQNLYTYIQKYHKNIGKRVLFITGDVLGADTRYFFKITGSKYLSKPFELNDLFVMLSEILDRPTHKT